MLRANYYCIVIVLTVGVMGPPRVNCTDGEVRLINGSSPNEGTVEICIFQVFGSICDINWDSREVDVVCNQLGYPTIGTNLA